MTSAASPAFDAEVLVVGGGPAGLTATSELIRHGRKTILIERGDRLGGMSASLEVGGQRVDLGSHRLHPSASAQVRQLLDRLLGDDLQVRLRNGRIRLAGRWVGFPLQPLDLVRSTPVSFGAKAVVDTITQPFRRLASRSRADTYEEVVRVGLGPAVLKHFYGPYAKKLWGLQPQELAGEVARRRISVRGPISLAKKLVSNSSEAPTFLYPRLGFGQIVDALSDEIESSDLGQIRYRQQIDQVRPMPTGVEVVLADGETLLVRRLFWTAPPHSLSTLVEGAPSELTSPQHRGVVLVYLTLDSAQYTPFDAHYFPELAIRSARISEPKNYRAGPDPTETTVLCAELACEPGDETWSATTDVLGQWVVDDLRSCELPEPEVLDVHVERLPSVYPVVTPESISDIRLLTDWANSLERVHVFGRQGLVVADNLHHVIDMALGAADCLGESDQWDKARWASLLESFTSNTVED